MIKKPRQIIYDYNTGSVYHCISSTRSPEVQWGEQDKEYLQQLLWKTSAFCGVELISYCIANRHLHVLVRVISGRSSTLTLQDLWEKVDRFYTRPTDAAVRTRLHRGLFEEAETQRQTTRKLLLDRMDNLSIFMKLLKQRFGVWYNHTHGGIGTHWYYRFESLLLEDTPHALSMASAYIALKPVRMGLCRDAADYPFSSYTQAVHGHAPAIRALCSITGKDTPQEALATFRFYLQQLLSWNYPQGSPPSRDLQYTR